ncbi:MAG: hypothetical protein HOP09_03090 [Hyphomicrobium sp.]|nr:hypothetical protein [Hyphomicrobium sp.]
MRKMSNLSIAAVAVLSVISAAPANAKTCYKKAAVGNALTETLAKFQVDAALLQSVSWGAYGTWVTGNGTPGWSFSPRAYKCEGQAIGWQCRGSATLCKLS